MHMFNKKKTGPKVPGTSLFHFFFNFSAICSIHTIMIVDMPLSLEKPSKSTRLFPYSTKSFEILFNIQSLNILTLKIEACHIIMISNYI